MKSVIMFMAEHCIHMPCHNIMKLKIKLLLKRLEKNSSISSHSGVFTELCTWNFWA